MAADEEESETLREIVSASPAVLYRLDVIGQVVRVAFMGDNLRAVLGYHAPAAMRDPRWWIDRVHPDDLPRMIDMRPDLFTPGHHVAMYRFRHANGDWIWLHDEAITRPTRDGVDLVGFFLDVTERQRLEEATRAAEERLRTVLDNTPVLISVVDRDGVITLIQGAGVAAAGFVVEELIERPVAPIMETISIVDSNGDESPARDVIGRVMGGETVTGTFKLRDAFFDVRISPLRDRARQIVGAGSVAIAVTERELAYQELRASRARLQVLSRQLIAAQEDERRRLARELHDEFGQDLTALKLDLAAFGRSDDPEERAGRVADALAIASRLIDRVRAVSIELHPSMLEDLGLVAALRWYVESQAERAGVEARFSAEPAEMTVAGDTAIVCYRIAQEAVTNVLRHAGARSLAVELALRDGRLLLRVRDDGKGFDAEAGRSARPGAGFGLLGMAERAALAGGRLTVTSQPGAGTQIELELPA